MTPSRAARSAAHSVVDPAQHGVTTLVAPLGAVLRRGSATSATPAPKIDALEKENAELRRQLRRAS